MVLDQVCNKGSGNIIRKREIIQTTGMKEKNVHSGQLGRTSKRCLWLGWYKSTIAYNTPYVALMRLCKLQMKHIPLGIGNLMVQEFKKIILVERQGLWSNAGFEFLHIGCCSELVQSTQNYIFKWQWVINDWLSVFWWLHYPKWQLGNDRHCFEISVLNLKVNATRYRYITN